MTVADLIKALQAFDPSLPVMKFDHEGFQVDIEEVNETSGVYTDSAVMID